MTKQVSVRGGARLCFKIQTKTFRGMRARRSKHVFFHTAVLGKTVKV